MRQAARAIIIQDNKILLMLREKEGFSYYTLIGGSVNENESIEQALIREVKEETGLDIKEHNLVFIEEHPEPYKHQYTYLCNIAPNSEVNLHANSEEALMNRVGINLHTPTWIELDQFKNVPFRTVQLQQAINQCLDKGFPDQPIKL